MSMTGADRIIEILGEYCGEDLRPDAVEIVPDLQIVDLFATRVDGRSEYLVQVRRGSVEKVTFDEWPPRRAETIPAPSTHQSETRKTKANRRAPMRINDLMCSDVYHCGPDDSLESAARLMWEHDCGCAPVCTGDGERQVVGMITDRDISMCALFAGKPLAQLSVRDAMSRDVISCKSDDKSSSVERLMSQRQVRRVPVVDTSGRLVGICSLADLVREAQPNGTRGRRSISGTEIRDTLAGICKPANGRTSQGQTSQASVGAPA